MVHSFENMTWNLPRLNVTRAGIVSVSQGPGKLQGDIDNVIADFRSRAQSIAPGSLVFDNLMTLQVNLGNMCNQQCQHCHMEASPFGSKIMPSEVITKIVDFLRCQPGITLDITGGCPEMNPDFRLLVEEARGLVPRLKVRTNLTVLLEKEMEWVAPWYRDNRIILIASMPCYTRENVDQQRGNGVFGKSIEALGRLNKLGYGDSLELDLVYNPGGAFLPSSQRDLEMDYKRELLQGHGIKFSNLFTITNAPLGRFRNYLEASDQLEQYVNLLSDNFNPEALKNIMCRSLISVDWQGILYDCDFNQVTGLPIRNRAGRIVTLDHMQDAIQSGREIAVAEHCYSCTAGAGSSCMGVLIGV